MEKWTYRRREYEMEWCGYGQYRLNGYITNASEIYDYANDDEQPKKMKKARLAAERFVSNMNKI